MTIQYIIFQSRGKIFVASSNIIKETAKLEIIYSFALK